MFGCVLFGWLVSVACVWCSLSAVCVLLSVCSVVCLLCVVLFVVVCCSGDRVQLFCVRQCVVAIVVLFRLFAFGCACLLYVCGRLFVLVGLCSVLCCVGCLVSVVVPSAVLCRLSFVLCCVR